jgi:hypothetical protein
MYPYQPQYAPQFASAPRFRTLAQAPAPSAGLSPGMKTAATLLTLGVTGAASWVGIRAGLKGKGAPQIAGWVGGIGAGLLGLATVINIVSPETAKTLMIPFKFPGA